MPRQGKLQQQMIGRWLACVLLLASSFVLSGCFDALPTDDGIAKKRVSRVFADPNAQKLALAAERGDVAEVTRLMKQEKLNPDTMFGKDGLPLVAWPVLRSSLPGLSALLENGANPNVAMDAPPRDGMPRKWDNALAWATERDDINYLTVLLEHGGDPNSRNIDGEPLIAIAFYKAKKDQKVRMLVEHGADPNADTRAGMTLIAQYASFGGFWMVRWLLEHGADPTLHYGFSGVEKQRDSYAIQSIFWYPSKPQFVDDQRVCQKWLLKRGYKRPPLGKGYRELRESLGEPTEERDIPLL